MCSSDLYFVASGGIDPARTEWRKQVLDDLRRSVHRALEMGIPSDRLLQIVNETLREEAPLPGLQQASPPSGSAPAGSPSTGIKTKGDQL